LEQVERRDTFLVADHVLANSGESADPLELDVKTLDLIGDAPSFLCQGGAVRCLIDADG